MKKLILLPVLGMIACMDTKGDTATEDTSVEDTSVETVDPTFSVAWGDTSVALTITDAADGADYFWGIAETGNEGGWTAEDCHNGYLLGSGDLLLYCHPAGTTGAELIYGAGATEVVEGESTLFTDNSFSAAVTYVVDDQSSADGACFTWGDDTTYYADYAKSCTEM